jgi:WD40 repeat protein
VRRRFTKNGHVKGINAVAWSDQRKILLTGSDDLSVKLWATLSEGPVGELRGHETSVLLILPIDSEQHVLTVSWIKP